LKVKRFCAIFSIRTKKEDEYYGIEHEKDGYEKEKKKDGRRQEEEKSYVQDVYSGLRNPYGKGRITPKADG
jgi:hypothetical protein